MRKFFISICFVALAAIIHAQGIVKGSGVVYTNGAPTHSINVNTDAEIAIDTATGFWYERSRDGLGWILAGFRVQKFAGTSPPSAAPLDKQSEIVLNDADSIYRWRASAWRHINKVLVYTAGTGISVTGTVIANTGDLSATNEGILGVGAGSGTTSIILSNTSGATGVTLSAGGIVSLSETTSSNGGTITITATEVDGSISNEGSLTVGAGTATTSIISSNTSGSTNVTLEAGTNITLSETGNTITINASGGSGSTDLTFSGASSPVTLNSSSGTDVTFTAGGIVSFSATSGNITITGTEVDGSVSNEGSLTVAAGTATTSVISSNTSGSTDVTLTAAGILAISESGNVITLTATEVDGSTTNEALTISDGTDSEALGGQTLTVSATGIATVDYVPATNTLTIGAVEVDGSVSNEGSLTVAAGTATTSIINSNTSGQTGVTLTAAGALSISESGNVITLTATEVDGSVSNEGSLTVAAGTATTSIINSNTSGQTGVTLTAAGALSISESGNVITLTATEVDGSTTNEGSLTVAAGTATTSVISSNTSGSTNVTLEAGTNITLSETGNTITINASGGSGSTDLTFSGASSPVTLNSSSGTDVTFTAGGIMSFSATSGNITLTATEVDGSTTNEALTISDGTDSENLGGQTLTVSATGIATVDYVPATNTLTIGAVEVDGSVSNEGSLTVGAGTGTTSIISSNTSGSTDVTLTAAGILSISESGNVITLTGTEVDGSVSNEGSLTVGAGTATTSIINSNTSGQTGVTLEAGTNITLSETGNTITIAASGGSGSTDLTFSGASSPVTLNSSTGTDVTFTAGGIMSFSATSGNITLTATEVDGSTTNEALTISDGTDSEALGGQTLTVSATGIATVDYVPASNTLTIGAVEVDGSVSNEGSLTVAAGTGTTSIINSNTSGQTGVTLTAAGVLSISESGNVITLTATEVDGSVSNEGSLTVAAGTATTSIINSNTSGQTGVTLTAAGALSISESGNVITLTATEVDGSTTNEPLTISDGTDSENLGGQTLTVSATGIATVDYVPATNTLTIGATEVDGSVSNEGSLTVAAGTGTTSIINSNTSGQTGVTLTAAGALSISESGNVITLTATEVDGSVSNEGSLTVGAGTGTTSIISSNTSGSTNVTLEAGSNITLSETGNTITIAASGSGSTDLTFSGASSPVTLNSSSGTDVTLTAGSNITLSATSGNITIAATGGGGAPTDAQYVTLATNATLTDERVFTAGVNTVATDGGAGSTLTLDVLGGNQTTSQFVADQDNFSPTNWSTRTTHYVSSDASIRAITSFSSLADGTVRRIVNTGSFPIYIPGVHPDGTAANRVITDCDAFIPPNGGVMTIFYDGTASRWRIQSTTFSAPNQGNSGAEHFYSFSTGATITGDWGTLTLVGNNDVAVATSSLLGGYSSNTSTSASGQGSWYFTDVLLNPTEYGLTHTVGSALIQITGNLSTSAQRYTAQLAFIPTPSSATLAVNNSIGIRYTDNENAGNWTGFTRNNAGTETTVDLGVAAAANTGYILTVCVDRANTEARFYINGVYRGRITTNLPTSGTDYGFRGGIWKSVGTTLRDIVTPWATFYTIK